MFLASVRVSVLLCILGYVRICIQNIYMIENIEPLLTTPSNHVVCVVISSHHILENTLFQGVFPLVTFDQVTPDTGDEVRTGSAYGARKLDPMTLV
jgi:hypothetical protein